MAAVPPVLVLLLADAITAGEGKLGFLSAEIFELGVLPLVVFVFLVMLLLFLPVLWFVASFTTISLLNSAAAGFLAALLPIVVSAWPVLSNNKFRPGFRMEHLAGLYPWLAIGVVGGALFWLLAILNNKAIGRSAKA